MRDDKKPVIVTTDGSPHSMRVIPHAARFAAARQAGLILLQVLRPDEVVKEPGETDAQGVERMQGRLLQDMAAELERHGVQAEPQVEVTVGTESTAAALLRRSADGDLLAMDSRGRGGIGRLLHGSVSRDVLGQVEIPMMLTGPQLLGPPAESHFYRILVTSDCSEASQDVLKALAPRLDPGRFQVTLLYVHEHAPGGQDDAALLSKRQVELGKLRNLLPAELDVNVVVTEVPRTAGIDTAILEEAREVSAHAIAMSTHGHSAQRHLLMGSVAMSVLGRSTLPLILARV